jgi:hypothetical protein
MDGRAMEQDGMMPPAKRPCVNEDLRHLRPALALLIKELTERATAGPVTSDRNTYARVLSHVAMALAQLPE